MLRKPLMRGFCQVSSDIVLNFPLKKLCTFKTGGIADALITPSSLLEFGEITGYLREEGIPHFILGGGSNVLFSDKGFRGAVIRTDRLDKISLKEGIIRAEAGVKLKSLVCFCRGLNIGGYEFLDGIPGTVGGACVMNAGAFKKEFKDVVSSVRTGSGIYSLEECGFYYRGSRFSKDSDAVLSVDMNIFPGDETSIRERIERYRNIRRENQPLKYPSAGSVFKKHDGLEAWRYVDMLNLRGYVIGGAQISEKHANFIINRGSACSMDIYRLIKLVKTRAESELGVALREEIRYVGEFDDTDR